MASRSLPPADNLRKIGEQTAMRFVCRFRESAKNTALQCFCRFRKSAKQPRCSCLHIPGIGATKLRCCFRDRRRCLLRSALRSALHGGVADSGVSGCISEPITVCCCSCARGVAFPPGSSGVVAAGEAGVDPSKIRAACNDPSVGVWSGSAVMISCCVHYIVLSCVWARARSVRRVFGPILTFPSISKQCDPLRAIKKTQNSRQAQYETPRL